MHSPLRRTAAFLAMALAVVTPGVAGAQQADAPGSIRLVLPENEDLTGLSIRYMLFGPFGGVSNFITTRPGTRTYDIDPRHEGQAAQTLKVMLHLPGRKFVLVSEEGFGTGPPKSVPVTFEALRMISLKGRVRGEIPPGLEVEADYGAAWMHNFFGIADGPVVTFTIDSVPLRPDGTFSLLVPDYASDPLVAGYDDSARGWIGLIAREPRTHNIAFFLRGRDKASGSGLPGVPIAASYPGELLFEREK